MAELGRPEERTSFLKGPEDTVTAFHCLTTLPRPCPQNKPVNSQNYDVFIVLQTKSNNRCATRGDQRERSGADR